MASTAPFRSSDNPRSVRQLKILVLVLVISNIGLGVVAFFLLRSLDNRYTALIGRSVPALNDLRELTSDVADAMRVTGTPLLNAPEAQRAEMARRARLALGRERSFRTSIMSEMWPSVAKDERPAVKEVGERFDSVSERLIELAMQGQIAEASRMREQMLRGAFDDYLAVIAKAADSVEGASLKANSELSARTESVSTVMLGIAGWPLIVLIALLLLTAVFVIVLMILFRGRELNETP